MCEVCLHIQIQHKLKTLHAKVHICMLLPLHMYVFASVCAQINNMCVCECVCARMHLSLNIKLWSW